MKAQERTAAILKIKEHAEQAELEFFHNDNDEAFVTVPVGDHRETWRVRSQRLRLWIMRTLHDMQLPASKALAKEIQEEFEMLAITGSKCEEVHVRIAEHESVVYLDLCDEQWQAVMVGPTGWRVVEPQVKFQRLPGMLALPHPETVGNIQTLRRFLNISHAEQLVMTWLSFALLPNHPYPILTLSGVQGSGKSTISKVLRAFVDPSTAPATAPPRSERDFIIAASRSHMVAIDNMSSISPELSDALCRAATGGSFRERRLYTNDEEHIVDYQLPIIINGISELPERPDLLDRCLLVHVQPISEEQRRDEHDFWRDFETNKAGIFGALLDVICHGLRKLPEVKLDHSPRMADFARWGIAVEEALGYPVGSFMQAYQANIQEAIDTAMEASPILAAIDEYLNSYPRGARGAALSWLSKLNEFWTRPDGDNYTNMTTLRKHPRWPKSAEAFRAELRRIEPLLPRLGIKVTTGRNHKGRYIQIELINPPQAEEKLSNREQRRREYRAEHADANGLSNGQVDRLIHADQVRASRMQ